MTTGYIAFDKKLDCWCYYYWEYISELNKWVTWHGKKSLEKLRKLYPYATVYRRND